jgi:hypothetical protein
MHWQGSKQSSCLRRSKPTPSRQQSNDAEPIGVEAEEATVEFEAVDVAFIQDEGERAPDNTSRMLKKIF